MKYEIILTSIFKKELKLLRKRNKDISKLTKVVDALSKGEKLSFKYRDHQLCNDEKLKNCRECHIEPDWLLVYKINNDSLILFLYKFMDQ